MMKVLLIDGWVDKLDDRGMDEFDDGLRTMSLLRRGVLALQLRRQDGQRADGPVAGRRE